MAATWRAVLEHYAGPYHLGVTATPERLDGRGLADRFDALVCGPDIAELTRDGYLADVKLLTVPPPDLAGINTVAGDYAIKPLARLMSSGRLVGDAVEHYQDHAEGRPAIAFCCSVAHAELVAERFRRAAGMPTRERDRIIGGLASGELQVVTSCALISKGLDIPDVGAAILLRPTKSLTLYLQQVGRALRPKADGRPALILDHAGNALRHGHPAELRCWSLKGRPAREAAERAATEREAEAADRELLLVQ